MRRRPHGNLRQLALRSAAEQRRRVEAGNRFYAPPASIERPGWLKLDARFRAEGEVHQVVSFRPAEGGSWEIMGHRTATRWYRADQVEPL